MMNYIYMYGIGSIDSSIDQINPETEDAFDLEMESKKTFDSYMEYMESEENKF